uniref:helix-turn-helix transcriptional regulator n=1 Tax=Halomonas sp. TaxID=1486246 RepID=UPI00262BC291|nr:AraC family transcriptional regulator [Halomonas sp.]
MSAPMQTVSRFLRHPLLPQVEIRRVSSGNALSHARHSHDCHSFGAIRSGRSSYANGSKRIDVSSGDVVVVNPGDGHACNALPEHPWGYDMLYMDSTWLTERCQVPPGAAYCDIPMFSALTSREPRLHQAIVTLGNALENMHSTRLELESHCEVLAGILRDTLHPQHIQAVSPRHLEHAREYLAEHWQQDLSLEALCTVAECGATSLINGFRRHYGMTPHAMLIDLRIRQARRRLRQGDAIASVAQDCGFADQAHFQRTFKRLLAATPGHYRSKVPAPP